MTHDVTIYTSAYTPVTFPSQCCVCLEPATTTAPVMIRHRKIRMSRTRRTAIFYPVELPYCAAHGAQAHLLRRYDMRATIGLIIAAVMALFCIELVLGRGLRAIGPLVWYGITLLLMAVLAVTAVAIYTGGRWVLKRHYPATVSHVYRESLGVRIATRLVGRPKEGEAVTFAITFTFSNAAFADLMAALHNTQAQPTPDVFAHE